MVQCVQQSNLFENKIVWNLGNGCPKLTVFGELFHSADIQDLQWDDFYRMWKDLSYGTFCYRSGMANRLGHANECPLSSSMEPGYWQAKRWNMFNRGSPKPPSDFKDKT